jgi:ABC-type bacteriocin/lantibiotic exporter with double-glycine peptidase domain
VTCRFVQQSDSLDVLTEQLVEENLSGLSCTRIVIAHRLSTIEARAPIYYADLIHAQSGADEPKLLAV